jgi:hypothetical protein
VKSRNRKTQDEVLLIIPAPKTLQPGFEPHGKSSKIEITKPLSELKNEWETINYQIADLIATIDDNSAKKRFTLDEVTFSLSLNAKGQFGLIVGGEIGGEASVTLTFKRNNESAK